MKTVTLNTVRLGKRDRQDTDTFQETIKGWTMLWTLTFVFSPPTLNLKLINSYYHRQIYKDKQVQYLVMRLLVVAQILKEKKWIATTPTVTKENK